MQKIAFKIYHWCVPSEHNGHFPHIWRERPFKILVFALIFLQFLSLVMILGAPRTKVFALVSENSLIKLTNETRRENNLLGLTWNNLLAKAAQHKAEDMFDKNYFAHTNPNGVTPWYWIQKSGYKYHFAGENLAMNFTNDQSVNQAWLKSPSHKANILNPNYSEMGIAVKSGKINGKETTIIVEFFASPAQTKTTGLIARNTENEMPDSVSSSTLNKESVFSTTAPAFTEALGYSPAEIPKIAGSTNESAKNNETFLAQKTGSLAEWFLSLPNRLIVFYALVFIALLILTFLNVIVRFNVQNRRALLHSGASLVIVLSLIVAQYLLLSNFVPIIL